MNTNEQTEDQIIRELMLALEFCRMQCERAEGKGQVSQLRLQFAASLATRVSAKHAKQLPDYGQDSFWKDVDCTFLKYVENP